LGREPRTSLIQINKGVVIQNNTQEFTARQLQKEADVHSQSQGETYYQSIKNKMNAQYERNDKKSNSGVNNSFKTPRSVCIFKSFDQHYKMQKRNEIPSRESRKFSCAQVMKSTFRKSGDRYQMSQSFDELKDVVKIHKLVVNIEKFKVRLLIYPLAKRPL